MAFSEADATVKGALSALLLDPLSKFSWPEHVNKWLEITPEEGSEFIDQRLAYCELSSHSFATTRNVGLLTTLTLTFGRRERHLHAMALQEE